MRWRLEGYRYLDKTTSFDHPQEIEIELDADSITDAFDRATKTFTDDKCKIKWTRIRTTVLDGKTQHGLLSS